MGSRSSVLAAAAVAAAVVACATGGREAAPGGEPAWRLDAAGEEFQPFDTPPEITKILEPEYPPYAKANQIEGRVMVRVTVSAKGKVEEARVTESTNRMFDDPALKAVRQFRFKPARLGDVAVRSTVMVPVEFRL